MRNNIPKIVPVILSYGCVAFSIAAVIKDILTGMTADSSFFLHILMLLCWCIVSIKWTIDYRKNKNTDNNTEY